MLKCVVFNARSIKQQAHLFELSCLLSDGKYAVIAITETWANDTLTDAMLVTNPTNGMRYPYSVFRCDRNCDVKKGGGGVCFLVHESFSVSQVVVVEEFSQLETVCVDIRAGESKHRLLCAYRPDWQGVEGAKLMSKFLDAICDVPYPITVVGDFNLNGIDWTDLSCEQDGVNNILLDSFLSNALNQCVTSSTRFSERTENILDLVLCSDTSCLRNLSVEEPFGKSDHMKVCFDLSIGQQPSETNCGFRDFRNADYQGICSLLGSTNWNMIFETCLTADDFYESFLRVMSCAIDTFVPYRRRKPGRNVRLPRRLRNLRNRKKMFWKNRKTCKNGRKMYSDCSKEFTAEIKEYARKQEEKCLNSGDVGNFYRFANSKIKSNKGIAPLKRCDGVIVDGDVEKCNILNAFFGSVFTVDDGKECNFASRVPCDVKKDDITITASKVCKLLKKLPNKMSRSPDGLPSLFLKKVMQYCKSNNCHECCICEPLARIFAVSFYRGELPKCWLKAEVVPIFKKGLLSDPGNYRPISLTSICCKLMESIVKQEVVDYLLSRKLLSKEQHGFLRRKSVCTQLLECTNDWTRALDTGKSVDVVYLDFAKAFDTVCHRKLLCKLRGYGISGNLLNWIAAFLYGRTQRVVINNSFSEWCCVVSGVPQGSVLGPLLFLMYVNDVSELVNGVKLKLFADDIKIYAETCVGRNVIQENLNLIAEWAETWQLKLACKKCVVLTIGRDRSDFVYMIDDVPLESVTSFRDLGVTMSYDLKSSKHCQIIVAAAMSRIGVLFRAFTTRNVDVLVKAYKTYIRPLLESGTPVWSPYLFGDIHTVN